MTPIVQPGQISAGRRDIVTMSGPGTVTSDATYYYRAMTANGTLTVTGTLVTDILIVGGGGGGAAAFAYVSGSTITRLAQGGGGAAGNVTVKAGVVLNGGTYNVTIGAGGAAESNGSQSAIVFIASSGGGAKGSQGIAGLASNVAYGGEGGTNCVYFDELTSTSVTRTSGAPSQNYNYASYYITGAGGSGAGAGGNGVAAVNETAGSVGGYGSLGITSAVYPSNEVARGGQGGGWTAGATSIPTWSAALSNTGDGGRGAIAWVNPSNNSLVSRGVNLGGGSGVVVLRYTRAQVGG